MAIGCILHSAFFILPSPRGRIGVPIACLSTRFDVALRSFCSHFGRFRGGILILHFDPSLFISLITVRGNGGECLSSSTVFFQGLAGQIGDFRNHFVNYIKQHLRFVR